VSPSLSTEALRTAFVSMDCILEMFLFPLPYGRYVLLTQCQYDAMRCVDSISQSGIRYKECTGTEVSDT